MSGRAYRSLVTYDPQSARQKVTGADYVRFSNVGRAVSTERLDEFFGHNEGDLDIVALAVAGDNPPHVLTEVRARSVALPPTGEWFEKSLKHFATHGKEPVFRMRGYPHEGTGTEFDYDNGRVVVQGAELMGRHVGRGPYPHTRQLQAFDDSPISDPNGMSGGPVRMRVSGLDEERFALVGMVLGGGFPNVFFATVEWLTAAVQKSMAEA